MCVSAAARQCLIRFAPLLGLVVLWQLLGHQIDNKLLPQPSAVLQLLWTEATQGDFWLHLRMTLTRVVISFTLAMTLGTTLGILMGLNPTLDKVLDTFLIIGMNIPALVVIIVCYIWLGLTEAAAITAVTLNKAPMVAVSLREGTRALDPKLFQFASVYQVSRWKILTHIIFPQLLPYLFGAVRNGLSIIWKIVLVVELLGCSNGFGFQIGSYFHFFDLTGVLAYTLAFTLVVFMIEYGAIRPIEQRMLRWRTL
ncbi:MAG: ssuC [Comamonadaceae bacterium]|nr:MAG: ssuC [Comamonadaceae bacterium]